MWNTDRKECWIVTSLKEMHNHASTFRIPSTLGNTPGPKIPPAFVELTESDSMETM